MKRVGLGYEKRAGEAIERVLGVVAKVKMGQWFEYEDENGLGVCQVDILAEFNHQILVFECKLTETAVGRAQLMKLYFPVLSEVYKRPVRGVVISRHLTKETNRGLVCDSLSVALTKANGVIPTLHWLGKGRI